MGLRKSPQKQSASLCKTICIGGAAGEGVKTAGLIIARALARSKYGVFMYDEYPSLIRGGHNSVSITFSPYPVYTSNREIDILVCLDRTTFDLHKEDLRPSSVVIYDNTLFDISSEDLEEHSCELIEINVSEIVTQKGLPRITRNNVFVGVCLTVAGIKKKTALAVVQSLFAEKGERVVEGNKQALAEGIENAVEYKGLKGFELEQVYKKQKKSKQSRKGKPFLLTGNEAISLGALQAGLGFYAAYPMTPASTILDVLVAEGKKYNAVVKQTEDEIAAINMAIGAAYAGVRAMTGTSGGGFSLMVEGVGLAAITETPLVIALSQRPGPATGLPTWTSQSDLLFVLHASQDEFPRVIFTPTDAEEAMRLTFEAFNIAEKYQLPVFVLVDKYLSESRYLFDPGFQSEHQLVINRGAMLSERVLSRIETFHRYEMSENGVSPRSIPGQEKGIFLANSDESDTQGFSNEDAENRTQKVEKRFLKTRFLKQEMPELNVYGNIRSKLCFVTWGSTKGAVLEAMRRLQNDGIASKLLALNYVEPFPTQEVEKFIKNSKRVILIENNYTGQLGTLISHHTGYELTDKLLKFDGRPVFPDEVVEFTKRK